MSCVLKLLLMVTNRPTVFPVKKTSSSLLLPTVYFMLLMVRRVSIRSTNLELSLITQKLLFAGILHHYAGSGRQSDKYELISQLIYKEIPADKRCTFEEWASLMNCVYKINDNGKWAILFAIMCAFRSNIHCIDRLFTAPFFMGPMSSGKTQIAISIRSLFISPKVPIFNLNIGTDAAMSTLMSTFRDVPVVLDEYNNKDISDTKFQALKGIVYDGDGRQKERVLPGKKSKTTRYMHRLLFAARKHLSAMTMP